MFVCNLRTIRPGWTSGSLRRGEANATSLTRATTLGGRSTQTSTVWFTPNISSWPPIWMTWRRTPSAPGTRGTIPDLLRTKIVKGPFFKSFLSRRFFPPEVFTMETERSWRDGEVLSKGSRVGKIQWMLQAAGRCSCYICILTICRESDPPVFAQYQIIPFALFGLCVIIIIF